MAEVSSLVIKIDYSAVTQAKAELAALSVEAGNASTSVASLASSFGKLQNKISTLGIGAVITQLKDLGTVNFSGAISGIESLTEQFKKLRSGIRNIDLSALVTSFSALNSINFAGAIASIGLLTASMSQLHGYINSINSGLGTLNRTAGPRQAAADTNDFSSALGRIMSTLRQVKDAADEATDAYIRMQRIQVTLGFALGDKNLGGKELDYVRGVADQLGVSLEQTASSYAKFAASTRGTTLEGQKTRDIFEAVSKASRVLGLSTSDSEGALRALFQMVSKGKVQAEELRGQLGDRLPGAFNMAAKAMGVTTGELDKMMKNGQVLAEELLPKLAVVMNETFGGASIEASKSLAAQFERVKTATFEVSASFGELTANKTDSVITGWTEALKDLNFWLKATSKNAEEVKSSFDWATIIKTSASYSFDALVLIAKALETVIDFGVTTTKIFIDVVKGVANFVTALASLSAYSFDGFVKEIRKIKTAFEDAKLAGSDFIANTVARFSGQSIVETSAQRPSAEVERKRRIELEKRNAERDSLEAAPDAYWGVIYDRWDKGAQLFRDKVRTKKEKGEQVKADYIKKVTDSYGKNLSLLPPEVKAQFDKDLAAIDAHYNKAKETKPKEGTGILESLERQKAKLEAQSDALMNYKDSLVGVTEAQALSRLEEEKAADATGARREQILSTARAIDALLAKEGLLKDARKMQDEARQGQATLDVITTKGSDYAKEMEPYLAMQVKIAQTNELLVKQGKDKIPLDQQEFELKSALVNINVKLATAVATQVEAANKQNQQSLLEISLLGDSAEAAKYTATAKAALAVATHAYTDAQKLAIVQGAQEADALARLKDAAQENLTLKQKLRQMDIDNIVDPKLRAKAQIEEEIRLQYVKVEQAKLGYQQIADLAKLYYEEVAQNESALEADQIAAAEAAKKRWKDEEKAAHDTYENIKSNTDKLAEKLRAKPLQDEISQVFQSIEQVAHDAFNSIFDGGDNAFKKLGETLKKSVLDLLYQMTVKQWIINIQANVSQSATNGGSLLGNLFGGSSPLEGGSNPFSSGSSLIDKLVGGNPSNVLDTSSPFLGNAVPNLIEGGSGSLLGMAEGSASAGAGLLGSVGSVLPWVGAIAGIASLLGGKRGGPKTGISQDIDLSGVNPNVTRNYAPSGGNGGTDALIASLSSGLIATLDKLGVSRKGLTSTTGFEVDPKGTASGHLDLTVLRDGKAIFNKYMEMAHDDIDAVAKNLPKWYVQALGAAAKDSEVAKASQVMIESLGNSDKPFADIVAILDQVPNVERQMRDSFGSSDWLSAEALKAAGGIEGLVAAMKIFSEGTPAYVAAISTQNDAQKIATDAFKAYGVEAPKTIQEAQALFKTMNDLNDPTGEWRAKLLALIPVVDNLQKSTENLAKTITGLDSATVGKNLMDSVFSAQNAEEAGANFQASFEKSFATTMATMVTQQIGQIIMQQVVIPMTNAALMQATSIQAGGATAGVAMSTGGKIAGGSISGAVGQIKLFLSTMKEVMNDPEVQALFKDAGTAFNQIGQDFYNFASSTNLIKPAFEPAKTTKDNSAEEAAKEAAKNATELADLMKKIQESIDTHGMTDFQKTLYTLKKTFEDTTAKAKELGASQAQLALITEDYNNQVQDANAKAAEEAKNVRIEVAKSLISATVDAIKTLQSLADNISKFGQSLDKEILTLNAVNPAFNVLQYYEKQRLEIMGKLNDTLKDDQRDPDVIARQLALGEELKQNIMDRYNVEMEALKKANEAYKDQLKLAVDLRDYIHKLKLGDLSTLSKEDKVAEGKRIFEETLALAKSGDKTAQGKLSGASDEYLKAASDYFASTKGYADIFQQVTDALQEFTKPALSTEELLREIADQDSTYQKQAIAIADRYRGELQLVKTAVTDRLGDVNTQIQKLGTDLKFYLGVNGDIYNALVLTLPKEIARLFGITGQNEIGTRVNKQTAFAGETTPTVPIQAYVSEANSGNYTGAIQAAAAAGYTPEQMAAAWNTANPDSQINAKAISDYLANLPKYAYGTDFVQGDQYAQLHHGEAVLTAGQNAARHTEPADDGTEEVVDNLTKVLREVKAQTSQNSQAYPAIIELLNEICKRTGETANENRLASAK